mmetsp:Transcript_40023/g.92031  ORF Transcript_40023/g.92031 Transcript_40023/m.92031 type:complete len:135 (-) Transcript_40023:405-809(-)
MSYSANQTKLSFSDAASVLETRVSGPMNLSRDARIPRRRFHLQHRPTYLPNHSHSWSSDFGKNPSFLFWELGALHKQYHWEESRPPLRHLCSGVAGEAMDPLSVARWHTSGYVEFNKTAGLPRHSCPRGRKADL